MPNWLWRRVKWVSTLVRCYRLSMAKKRGAGRPPRIQAIWMARHAAHIASTDPRRSYPKSGWLEEWCVRTNPISK